MCDSKVISILFLIFYAVLLFFTFNTSDANAQMIAMKMMGTGMFLEAVVSVVYSFKHHNHK